MNLINNLRYMEKDEIKKEITNLYREILQREPDKLGLKHWEKKIREESYTIDKVKKELLQSEEYKILEKTGKSLPEFQCKLLEKEIIETVENTSWYHSFNFNGIPNSNTRTTPSEQLWITQNLPESFQGKSVIDVGCADGFFGFYAAKNNARKVVCGDFMMFEGFKSAQKIIDLNVEHRTVNLFDFKETEKFDYVFCFGLYYHLPDPVQSIRYLQSITNEALYFAGPITNDDEPIMYYYDPYELYSTDDSNWWVASPSCITGIAKRIGFKNAEMIAHRPAEHWALPLKEINSKRVINKYGLFKFSK